MYIALLTLSWILYTREFQQMSDFSMFVVPFFPCLFPFQVFSFTADLIFILSIFFTLYTFLIVWSFVICS